MKRPEFWRNAKQWRDYANSLEETLRAVAPLLPEDTQDKIEAKHELDETK